MADLIDETQPVDATLVSELPAAIRATREALNVAEARLVIAEAALTALALRVTALEGV